MYVRISEDRAGERAGVQRQREDCTRRCRERGWRVASVEEDNDISAAGRRVRPGFERVLAALESGAVQVVVAWALDRLQRNRRDELRLYETCERRGAVLHLINGPEIDFATSAGKFVAEVLGSTARLEIGLKSDRQARAALQAARAGKRRGGRRPFGFDDDGVTVREGEAAAVRDGFRMVLQGATLAEVARAWTAAGFHTGQSRQARSGHAGEPSPWHSSSVRHVLQNPRYAGLRSYRGEVVARAEWPALVDDDTFEGVRAILSAPGRRAGVPGPRRLLSGLGLCAVCGATIHAGGNTRRGIPGYRCSASLGHLSRKAQPVDGFVRDVMVARLSRPDARDLLVDERRPNLGALRREARQVQERLDTLAVDFADGALTSSQLRTATTRLRSRLRELDTQMSSSARIALLKPLLEATNVGTAWDALPVGGRREVIAALAVVRVAGPGRGVRRFDPATVDIEWRRRA